MGAEAAARPGFPAGVLGEQGRGVGVGGSRLQPPERRGRVLCVSPTPLLLGLKVVFFTDFIYLIYIPI